MASSLLSKRTFLSAMRKLLRLGRTELMEANFEGWIAIRLRGCNSRYSCEVPSEAFGKTSTRFSICANLNLLDGRSLNSIFRFLFGFQA